MPKKLDFPALNFGSALINAVLYASFALCLAFVGWWSLEQTVNYSHLISVAEMAWPIGIVIQFGQNFALWMRSKSRPTNLSGSQNWRGLFTLALSPRTGWLYVWAGAATLDAMTNIGQWRVEHAEAVPWSLVWILGHGVCIGVVGVEEVMAWAVATMLHHFNDLIQAIFRRRLDWLEWAEDEARRTAGAPQNRNGDQINYPPSYNRRSRKYEREEAPDE